MPGTLPVGNFWISKSNIFGLGLNAARPTEQVIQSSPGGAWRFWAAEDVLFPFDVKAGSPVVITAPDARPLSFRATFLALHDLASGQSLLIAEVTNRIGLIVGADQVIYTNAFDTLLADIRYHYTRQSLEQDIVLHGKPCPSRRRTPAGNLDGVVQFRAGQ